VHHVYLPGLLVKGTVHRNDGIAQPRSSMGLTAAHMGKMRNAYKTQWRKSLGDLGINWRIILK
jgi:hypothetical protein